jgi:hypothetical protein
MIIATDKKQRAGVHVSTMTGKLAGIQAINTNTLTNKFCSTMRDTDAICGACYSAAMLSGSRKNCVPAFEHNSALLSSRELQPAELPAINAAIFRFHGHGELINSLHLRNLYAIADKNPATIFALWTKRRDIIRKGGARPANLILIYSNPSLQRVISKAPKGFDKVFNNVPKDYAGAANCTGQKCIDCRACYQHGGETVIVEHAKVRH